MVKTELYEEGLAWVGHRVEVRWPGMAPGGREAWLPGLVVASAIAYGLLQLEVELDGSGAHIFVRKWRLPPVEDTVGG